MNMKKANNASSKPQRKSVIESGNEVLSAEQYQTIRGYSASVSEIIDADKLQIAKAGIVQRVCEDMVIA